MDELVDGVVWYAVLVFSLTFHEASHAFVAMRGGDLTAYQGGQVSLDPVPHIRREPFGMVVVPILAYAWGGFMFGWASTPFDRDWAHAHPKRAGWMSLAGPGANLLLVLLAALAIRAGMAAGIFYAPDSVTFSSLTAASQEGVWTAIALVLSVLFTLNLLLVVFNLIPVPPLDGSGALSLLVDDDTARRIQQTMSQPALAIGGILIAWFLIGRIFPAVHLFAINLLYPGMRYG